MSKLTLKVDAKVIARTQRYAKERGMSVSKMVEAYLAAVTGPRAGGPMDTPILRSVRGILKNAAIKDYRKYLADKHR